MEIKLPTKQKIAKTAKEFNLKLVLLFGSRVSGKTHKESDVDLAFLSEKELSFEEEILLNTKFCGLFRTDRVDTVNLKKAPPLLAKQIISNYKILYEKKAGTLNRLSIYIYRKYFESEPLFKLVDERLKSFVSKK